MNIYPHSSDPREYLILALDLPSAARAFALLDSLEQRAEFPPKWVKVGLELFLAEGASLIGRLRDRGYSVFLDLKLHDIPNTVASAIRVLAPLGVELLTVHAAGGPAMLQAAASAASASVHPPRLLAVTVLTSFDNDQLRATGVDSSPHDQVLRLAHLSQENGMSGLVASPLEAARIRADHKLSASLHLVTPGIRPEGVEKADDQQRVATAADALHAGANQLVIGRPITQAAYPVEAYAAMLAEIQAELLARPNRA